MYYNVINEYILFAIQYFICCILEAALQPHLQAVPIPVARMVAQLLAVERQQPKNVINNRSTAWWATHSY